MNKLRLVTRSVAKVFAAGALSLALVLLTGFAPLVQLVHADDSVTPVVGVGETTDTSVPVPVTGLALDGADSSTTVANVSVSFGSLTLPASPTGVTYMGGVYTGQSITLSGSVSDINNALDNVSYSGDTAGSYTLYLSVLPDAHPFDATSKHMYSLNTGHNTWSQASAAAGSLSLDSVTGYLININSPLEDYVAKSLVDGSVYGAWIGANDLTTLGTFKWMTGPDAPEDVSGGDNYTNWNPGQPIDVGGTASCAFLQTDESGHNPVWATNVCGGGAPGSKPGTLVEYDVSGLVDQATETITVNDQDDGGGGAPSEPTVSHDIATCDDLEAADANPDYFADTFNVTADLYCGETDMHPLSWGGGPFTGTFDGHGFTIHDINIVDDNGDPTGLFSFAITGTIKNVNLSGGSIENTFCDEAPVPVMAAGGIAGYTDSTNLSNITSDLTVTSDCGVAGGIVGEADGTIEDSTIHRVSSTGDVTGGSFSGGLFGVLEVDSYTITVEQSFATGDVTNADGDDAGGLIGDVITYASGGDGNVNIQDVYATGNVSASATDAGGLIGYIYSDGTSSSNHTSITIQRAYASGSTTAFDDAGGLIGYADSITGRASATIQDVFATGQVNLTDGSETGAILGYLDNSGTAAGLSTNGGIYYDATRTGMDHCASDDELGDCTAKNVASAQTDYFFGNNTSEPMASWDFSTIWKTNDGDYPTFVPEGEDQGQPIPGDIYVTLPSDADGSHIEVHQTGCTGASDASTTTEPKLAVQDPAYQYPVGFVGFTFTGCQPSTQITALFTGDFDPASSVIRKYNTATNTYSTLTTANSGIVLTKTTLDGKPALQAVYTVTDGGALDQDGQVNGTIVDPIGVGQLVVSVPNTGFGD